MDLNSSEKFWILKMAKISRIVKNWYHFRAQRPKLSTGGLIKLCTLFFQTIKKSAIFPKNGWFWLKFWEFSKTDVIFELSVQNYLLEGLIKLWTQFFQTLKKSAILPKNGWFWLKFWEFSKTDVIFELSVQNFIRDDQTVV